MVEIAIDRPGISNKRSPLSIHNTDRPFHIVKNSQKAIALCDLFQKADRDACVLVSFGWNGEIRVHSTILHLRVFEDKLWIERDETEEGVTQDLRLSKG